MDETNSNFVKDIIEEEHLDFFMNVIMDKKVAFL